MNKKVYSFLLFLLLGFSILSSLPSFKFNVPSVAAVGADPVNRHVYSNVEFAQNVTVGWINVSVSDADGYGNIESVVVMVNTTGNEILNFTWTQATDFFNETSDSSDIAFFFNISSFSSTFGTDYYNLSFNLAFIRGTVGECNVTVVTTDDDSNVDTDLYVDQFFLSDFNRATGVQWAYDEGFFNTIGWDRTWISDTGSIVIVAEHFSRDILTFSNNGTLIFEYDMPNSTFGYYSGLSGDGNYVVYATTVGGAYNYTLYNSRTGEHVWSIVDASDTPRTIDINYDASITVFTTNDGGTEGLSYYDFDGFVWRSTLFNGIGLPVMTTVSVSRDANIIAAGSDPTGGNWPNSSVFVWHTISSTVLWVWNSSDVPLFGLRAIEVTDLGDYIVAADGVEIYGTNFTIFEWDSSTPLLDEQWVPFVRVSADMQFDVAYEFGDDSIYFVGCGLQNATAGNLFNMMYNLTTDTFSHVWNYSGSENEELRATSLSSIMQNTRYYIALTGDSATYYFDTDSNSSIWSSVNATRSVGYFSAMNRLGNRFTTTHTHTVNKLKFLVYYSYGDELPFVNIKADITNMEDDASWIFANERFYHFEAQVSHLIDASIFDFVGLRFSDEYSTFTFWYNNSARAKPNVDAFSLIISPQFDADKDPGAINIESSSADLSTYDLTVTWDIWIREFTFDVWNVDLYIVSNDTDGNVLGWELLPSGTNLFNIYVVGGSTFYNVTGDAGIGDPAYTPSVDTPFEMYANESSSVYVETYYRKLQHVQLQYGVWIDDPYISGDQNYTLDIGIDFLIYQDDYWYKGWKTQIQTFTASESITGNNRWFNMSIEHYRWNPTTGGSYEPMRQAKMYAYWEGFESEDNFYQVHTDLWFSSSNNSRMFGVRVNPVYYGMKNDARFGMGWLFGNDWRTLVGNVSSLTYKDFIKDSDDGAWGDIRSTTEIVMVRFWMNLSRESSPFPYYVKVKRYVTQKFNTQSGFDQFVGVDNPAMFETLEPHIEQGGGLFTTFFGHLYDAIILLRDAVVFGAISAWTAFVPFMDNIAAFFGFEGGFSRLISYVSSFAAWMTTSFTYVISLITSFFGLFSVSMSKFLTLVTSVFSGWVDIFQVFISIIDDGFNTGFNIYTDYIAIWMPLIPVGMLIYFYFRLTEDGMDAVYRDIQMIFSIFSLLFTFLITIIQVTLNIISTIIESIPVIE